MTASLTHLQRLEAESIQIMREAVAGSERPVMLYSIGKDSSVMLRLAQKAFAPSVPPFPLLHVDTTWKFQAMYELHEKERDLARRIVGPDRSIEAFVDTSLADAEGRDRKGLYARARRGEIANFTGIDSPYEPPLTPDLHLATAATTPDELAEVVVARLRSVLDR